MAQAAPLDSVVNDMAMATSIHQGFR
jgi:hypothetical protein